ncbi:MAG: hypothetical protein HY694_09600 [Deltaproteobacteria bacterium]|nr:hypothetical protein [Deltaproteobacteria bacterium]
MSMETPSLRLYPRFLRPHKHIAFGAENKQNGTAIMMVGFMIAPNRPFGDVAHERTPSHIKSSDVNARPFSFSRVNGCIRH